MAAPLGGSWNLNSRVFSLVKNLLWSGRSSCHLILFSCDTFVDLDIFMLKHSSHGLKLLVVFRKDL